MGAVERLQLKLARVYVPPHERLGNPVKGYWRSLHGRRVSVRARGEFGIDKDYEGVLQHGDETSVQIREPGGTVRQWPTSEVRKVEAKKSPTLGDQVHVGFEKQLKELVQQDVDSGGSDTARRKRMQRIAKIVARRKGVSSVDFLNGLILDTKPSRASQSEQVLATFQKELKELVQQGGNDPDRRRRMKWLTKTIAEWP